MPTTIPTTGPRTTKIQLPLDIPKPLPGSLRQSLIDSLMHQTTTIPDLLSSLQDLATSTGFFDRVQAHARRVAVEDEHDALTKEEATRKIIEEIMASVQRHKKDGARDGTEAKGESVELAFPNEMVEEARRIVREGLNSTVEIMDREEKEARENGWL